MESGPKFTGLIPSITREKTLAIICFSFLDISVHFGDIPAQSEKGSEIGPDLAFFAPKIFLGQAPKFLDRHL